MASFSSALLSEPLAAFQLADAGLQIDEAAGGFSGARTFRVRTATGDWAIKRWPPGRRDGDRIAWIFQQVAAAHDAGIWFLARPRLTSAGSPLFDDGEAFWSAAPWKPGLPASDGSPNPAAARACAAALAELHLAWGEFSATLGPAPVVARAKAALDRLLSKGGERLAGAVDASPDGLLGGAAAKLLAASQRAARPASTALQYWDRRDRRLHVCLRDAQAEHFLIEDGAVSGVIDYDAVAIDSPLGDLARLLGSMTKVGSPAWNAAIEAYCQVLPLDDESIAFCCTLAKAWPIAAAASWLHWVYVERRAFSAEEAVRRRCRRLLERLLAVDEVD